MGARFSRWTNESIDLLKKLWAENEMSCQDISVAIESALGLHFSRNAITGQVWRLGLPSHRPSAASRRQAPKRKYSTFQSQFYPAVKPPNLPAPRRHTGARNLPLLELRAADCRFPVTEDSPFLFCGLQQAPGSSYCPYHHVVATEFLPPDKPIEASPGPRIALDENEIPEIKGFVKAA